MSYSNIKGFGNLSKQLKKRLKFQVKDIIEVFGGANSRIFRLESTKKDSLLVKFYQRDERCRLEREFGAFSFLRGKGFTNIPKVYFKNSDYYYAVYSFEKGLKKKAAKLTKSDLDSMIDFLVELQKFRKMNIKAKFKMAPRACVSYKNYIENIKNRLNLFMRDYNSDRIHPLVKKQLKSTNIEGEINGLVSHVVESLTEEEILKKIASGDLRLNPYDFGSHNTIFKKDGTVCFVDFEYFGWDDPLKTVIDFLNHDKSRELSVRKKEYFKNIYLGRSTLPNRILKRFEITDRLYKIEWLTVYLYSVSSKKIESRKFADSKFDLERYVVLQSEKFRTVLEKYSKEIKSTKRS